MTYSVAKCAPLWHKHFLWGLIWFISIGFSVQPFWLSWSFDLNWNLFHKFCSANVDCTAACNVFGFSLMTFMGRKSWYNQSMKNPASCDSTTVLSTCVNASFAKEYSLSVLTCTNSVLTSLALHNMVKAWWGSLSSGNLTFCSNFNCSQLFSE